MRKAMTPARRARVLAEHGERCHACQTTDGPFQIDHWVPLFLGGSEDEENLRPLCEPCHMAKTKKENHVRGKINRLSGKNRERPKRKWPSRKIPSRPFPKRQVADAKADKRSKA